jgi:predicted nuclease with TOPRIM domain
MSENIIINILSVIGGGFGWQILSTFVMPKKEKRDADQNFIDTLLDRITHLEARLDEQSKQIQIIIQENASLKIEMNYLIKENTKLKSTK